MSPQFAEIGSVATLTSFEHVRFINVPLYGDFLLGSAVLSVQNGRR